MKKCKLICIRRVNCGWKETGHAFTPQYGKMTFFDNTYAEEEISKYLEEGFNVISMVPYNDGEYYNIYLYMEKEILKVGM